MYKVQSIANTFLQFAKEDEKSIDHLKIQKLVYIAYGIYAGVTGNKLFKEDIKAWPHGPVIEPLYHEAKHFGSEPFDPDFRFKNDEFEPATILEETSDERSAIILTWERYRDDTGWELRNRTHESNTPWSDTKQCEAIPFDHIRIYYEILLRVKG